MTHEYLNELADLADPGKLWRLPVQDQLDLPAERRRQLDTGVALRRHAAHVRQLCWLLGTGKSLVITPVATNGVAVMTMPTPIEHMVLVEHQRVMDGGEG